MTSLPHDQLFHVTYFDKHDKPMSTTTIAAWDYWEACTRLLGSMPPGAEDFNVEEMKGGG